MNFRKLDDRFVPGMAHFVQRRTDRLVARLPKTWRERLAEPPPPPRRPVRRGPAGPAPVILRLRHVDDRYARRGPLGLVRDVPQVGALALALIVLVGGATAWQRHEDQANRQQEDQLVIPGDPGSPGPDDPADDTDGQVGPDLGDNVPDYLAATLAELQRKATGPDRDTPIWSVVSFDRYLTPDQVVAVAEGITPRRVVLRVPPTSPSVQADTIVMPVTDLAKDLPKAFQAAIAAKLEEARSADSQAATAANDPAYQAEYKQRARQLRAEAAVLQRGCACVFGLIVKAKPVELVFVAARDAVRTVDIGPVGVAFEALNFRALTPEEVVTVTGGNEGFPGG